RCLRIARKPGNQTLPPDPRRRHPPGTAPSAIFSSWFPCESEQPRASQGESKIDQEPRPGQPEVARVISARTPMLVDQSACHIELHAGIGVPPPVQPDGHVPLHATLDAVV